MSRRPSKPGQAVEVGERTLLLGVSASLPLAVAGATAYAVVCTVVAVGAGDLTAASTGSVLPYEQTRAVVIAGIAVGAGVAGESLLRRLRGIVTRA